MSSTSLGTVRIKTICIDYLKENLDRISVLFAAHLEENSTEICPQTECSIFDVFSLAPSGCERAPSVDFIPRLQKYVDDICGEGCQRTQTGEDSSYDSDYDPETITNRHQDVSRTTSDTLAAEYAEYVQSAPLPHPPPTTTTTTTSSPSPPTSGDGYTARVEFALKLGYTERLVQAALQKLGPNPAQNELLAELIKLGAHKGAVVTSSCETSPTTDGGGEGVDGADGQGFRPIVIDGSNVAMSHGNKEIFSCRGIKIAVDWFKSRGHREITVFVPKWRKEAPRPDNPIRDQELLAELERDRLLVFTPSRLVGGKRMVCYDDRYILKLAAELDGIVVSNDNYRDLCQENGEFKRVVEEKILMYSFAGDRFMPPDDPLGRSGPTLDSFLKRRGEPPPPPCPYGKKCTYGNKCKYNHPERGPLHKSVTERLSEHAQRHLLARENSADVRKMPLGRTRSNVPPSNQKEHDIISKSLSVDNARLGICTSSPDNATANSENFHRKLQRQLTLNPGNDARLVQRRFAPPAFVQPWEVHQHVTRIASAPDSYRWPPPQQQQAHFVASCSDPQLNAYGGGGWSQEEVRRKLHYHLAAIFPEEQVAQVMRMYPEETNAQKICAAILSLFPKN